MPGSYGSSRLGDLLVKKGKITRQQLLLAIRFQQERRVLDVQNGISPSAKNELGAILIELGFISRKQLRNCLSWQKKLRKATLLMTFCAPLLTVACGGGSGSGSESTKVSTVSTISTSQTSSIKSSSTSSVSSGTFSSASSSSKSPFAIDGPVLISWSPPPYRENGEYLDVADLGGYELRYRLKNTSQYKSIHIKNGYTDSYYFDHLQGDYEFEIAAYDKEGLYSDFVAIKRL